MRTFFKKRMIDERMELQSLKNVRKCWNFLLLATGFSLLAEMFILQWDIRYVIPQAIIVLAASVYNLFLDAKDGNIYTAESSNRKKIFLLYAISAFTAALILGYHFYNRYTRALGIVMFFFSFFFMLGCMYLVDSLCYRIGKKRALKGSEDEEE